MTAGADISQGASLRAAGLAVFLGELYDVAFSMRWALLLLMMLIIADFRYGWEESSRRRQLAIKRGDAQAAEYYRWHTSRAIRRTLNKLVDYVIYILLFGTAGKALLAPVGIGYEWSAWAVAAVECFCELSSVSGHFFYMRGVKVEKRTIKGFMRALIIAFARRKSEDVGAAVEDAFNKTDKKGKE